jgi:anti-sigma-K factor RskA
MTHVEARELLALHALGALEEGDTSAVASHVEGCRGCRAELAELQATAAELARASEPVSPSAEVTRRILAAADRESGRPAARRALPPAPPSGTRARRSWRLVPIAAGIVGIAVVGLLLVSHVSLQRRLERASAMLARGRELLEFMASPDVVTVSLAGTASAPDARALVSYDRRSGRVVVIAFELAPPASGHVYQLWRIADGVRSGIVFSTDASGGTLLRDQWAPEEGDIPVFAVTLEPAPGVDDPTGKIVLLGGALKPRAAVAH